MASLVSASLPTPAARRDRPSRPWTEFRSFWRQFLTRAFDPYRPELHYMRGPGPACHAKMAGEIQAAKALGNARRTS